MRNIPFTGSGVALITPFKNGSVDFDKLGELIDFHINNKTDAIIVCGTTGEAATMPDAEHLSVIEYTVKTELSFPKKPKHSVQMRCSQ